MNGRNYSLGQFLKLGWRIGIASCSMTEMRIEVYVGYLWTVVNDGVKLAHG